MRKGEAMNSRTDLGGASLPQVYEARVAAKRSQLQAQEDMASLQAARRAADAVKRIEAEARRLEKALQKQRKLGAPPEPVRARQCSGWRQRVNVANLCALPATAQAQCSGCALAPGQYPM